MNAERSRVEGFLSLEQAAQQLDFSVSELSRQIEEGRVVAIVREGCAWLSTGEVTRLKRQSERAVQAKRLTPVPMEGSRLHRASRLGTSTTSSDDPAEPVRLSLDRTGSSASEEARTPADPSGSDLSIARQSPTVASTPDPALSSDSSVSMPVKGEQGGVEPTGPSQPEEEVATAAPVLKPPVEVAPKVPVELPAEVATPAPVTQSPMEKAPEVPGKSQVETATAAPVTKPTVGTAPKTSLKSQTEGGARAPEPHQDIVNSKMEDLTKRYAELEIRNQELENTVGRLKLGLTETEATLKRNRIARGNLENEVIGLQDQLGKARSRSEALEREVQHLGAELDRIEEVHAGEMRRARSVKERASEAPSAGQNGPELEEIRQRMLEKDRLLTQEYEQRAALRSQLEEVQQKYFELKAIYDKEKGDWSEVLAKSVQNQNLLREQIEELKAKSNPKGWNPFRRDK